MIAFKAKEFEQALPEIREEVRRRANDAAAEGVEPELVMISAEEYARLIGRRVIRLDDMPVEFIDEMVRQLDEAIQEREAAGERE